MRREGNVAKTTSTSGGTGKAGTKKAAAGSETATPARKRAASAGTAKTASAKAATGTKKAASSGKAKTTGQAASSAKAAGKTASKAASKTPAATKAKAAPAKPSAKTTSGKKTPAKASAPKKPAARPKTGAQPWLKNYPEGVPAAIAPLEHASLGDLMVESCRTYADRPAFTCMDKSLTFGELEALSSAFGAYLQSLGLKKGARVALMMPNILQYPVAMMAVLRAGYIVVNVNPLYTPRELEHQLADSGAEAIVILENFAATLEKVIARTKVRHVVTASMGDLMGLKGVIVNFVVRRVKKLVPSWSLPGHTAFNEAIKTGKGQAFAQAKLKHDDIAFLQYTGGTTGVSKGATLTHGNVLANVAQNALWVDAAYAARGRPEQPVYICALPLYHIFALTVNALMGVQQGARNVLIPNPRDIPTFVGELGKYKFHVFPGLNTLFNALLNNDDFADVDFSELRLTVGGGMAVQRSVAERWKEVTGSMISEGYGLSETSPVATANRFDGEKFTGTIGMPIPSTEVDIRGENGKSLPFGEVGEICIRGPQVMTGYWNQPEESAKAMTKDGFFRSGDMGFMDEDGYVKIVDRKKDMILVSGFNVYPAELEDVVSHHPGVLEVAAVGVPDDKSGEAPKLFVVRKDESLTEQALLDYCKEQLTGYKRPRHVEFREELPKTNVGKILRRELK